MRRMRLREVTQPVLVPRSQKKEQLLKSNWPVSFLSGINGGHVGTAARRPLPLLAPGAHTQPSRALVADLP